MAETTAGENGNKFQQHAGRVGSHRLLPGEQSAFRVDFEGYLKIQDQPFNGAYDPDEFSLPEFDGVPSDIDLSVSTTVCAPAYYKSLTFSEIDITETAVGNLLKMTVTNSGTEIVSTLQLKISFIDVDGRLMWVEPYYLQNNLVPGEIRALKILLHQDRGSRIGSAGRLQINSKTAVVNQNSIWPLGIKLPNSSESVIIDYDAMLYRPLD